MENFFSFLKFVAVLIGIIIIIFLILLALPKSKLRDSLLKAYSLVSSVIAIISALYVISPADLIPDLIPVAGQSDDLAALFSAIVTAVSAYIARKKSQAPVEEKND